MSSDIAIRVTNLSKCYQIYDNPRDRLKQFVLPRFKRAIEPFRQFVTRHPSPVTDYYKEFWALKDVSFEVKRGETVGIIGRNGSGKSTLLQMICGTLTPTGGTIETFGRVAALLELGSGFNMEFSGRENVYMNASILGLSMNEIDAKFNEITAFADIGEFIEQPVKTYSSGMFVRLAFAVVVHVDPDILVIDEALAVGDAFFQAKCMSKMKQLVERGTTILLVSHDINSVKALCSRTLWLNQGIGCGFGKTSDVVRLYTQNWINYVNEQNVQPSDDSKVEPHLNVQPSDDSKIEPHLNVQPSDDSKVELSPHLNTKPSKYDIEQDLKFSSRSGAGQAQFIAFQCFCDNEAVGQNPLDFGSSLRILCLVEIKRKCENLVVSLHIKDRNNQHLVGFNSGALPEVYDKTWQQGERFQVEFKMQIILQAGRYAITALISSLSDKVNYSDVIFVDWVEDIGVFEVAARNPFPLSDWVEPEHEITFSVA